MFLSCQLCPYMSAANPLPAFEVTAPLLALHRGPKAHPTPGSSRSHRPLYSHPRPSALLLLQIFLGSSSPAFWASAQMSPPQPQQLALPRPAQKWEACPPAPTISTRGQGLSHAQAWSSKRQGREASHLLNEPTMPLALDIKEAALRTFILQL